MKKVMPLIILGAFLIVLLIIGCEDDSKHNLTPPSLRITSFGVSQSCVLPDSSVEISAVVYYEDEDNRYLLTYQWGCTGGTITGTDTNAIWTAPSTIGEYRCSLIVHDGKASWDTAVTIIDVINLTITSLQANPNVVAPNDSTEIIATVDYSGSGELSYNWSCISGTIVGDSDTVVWKAPSEEGDYKIDLSVTDGTLSDDAFVIVEVTR